MRVHVPPLWGHQPSAEISGIAELSKAVWHYTLAPLAIQCQRSSPLGTLMSVTLTDATLDSQTWAGLPVQQPMNAYIQCFGSYGINPRRGYMGKVLPTRLRLLIYRGRYSNMGDIVGQAWLVLTSSSKLSVEWDEQNLTRASSVISLKEWNLDSVWYEHISGGTVI